jgi:ABC-type transport system substrate-binding protein
MKKHILLIGFGVIVVSLSIWVIISNRMPKVSESGVASKTIAVALESEIESLDPINLRSPVTSRVVWQVFEGLVGLDESGQAIGVIAESWESSKDFREWTFHIRHGVLFHPDASFGTPNHMRTVQAEDISYSYHRHAKNFGSFVLGGIVDGFDNYIQGKVKNISGISVVNPLEIRFRLIRPEPYFIYRLTSPYLSIMPKECIEFYGAKWGVKAAIGTGPFCLASAEGTHFFLNRLK